MPPKPNRLADFPNDIERVLPDHDMVFVAGGPFLMGGQDEEVQEHEKPVHQVTLGDFSIGKYPVTQALWKAVMGAGNNPSFFAGDRRPVETVSRDEAKTFIDKLNEKTGRAGPGLVYRLPTEAEWEYAARGGQASRGHKYAGSDKLKEVGWYCENSHSETKPVGLKDANELDLYDMSGNVWEWVEDHLHRNYEGTPTDSSAWTDGEAGSTRELCGGGWPAFPHACRVAARLDYWPAYPTSDLGFRLVLALQSDGR